MTTLERLLLQNQQLSMGFFLENHYLKGVIMTTYPYLPLARNFYDKMRIKGGISYVKNHPPKTPQTNTNTYPVILRISGGFKVAPHLGSGKIRLIPGDLTSLPRGKISSPGDTAASSGLASQHRGCHSPRQVVGNQTSTPQKN